MPPMMMLFILNEKDSPGIQRDITRWNLTIMNTSASHNCAELLIEYKVNDPKKERRAYGCMSVSLCGSNPGITKLFYGVKEEKKEKNNEKEVVRRESSVICLTGRSPLERGKLARLTPNRESAGVKPFVKRPAQQKTDD